MNLNDDYNIKAIVFDLDDTLYSEKEYVKSGFHAVSKILSDINDVEMKLWRAFEKHQPAIDVVLKSEDIYSDALKKRCLHIYQFHEPDIHLYEGIENMLIGLLDRGIKIGIITDGRSEGQRAKIRSLGLDRFICNIIVTDELGGIQYRKPNDLAFRMMKEKLGVLYEQMVYVGDNPNKDFIAPVHLGMKAWWLRNNEGIYYTKDISQNESINIIDNINMLICKCNAIYGTL